MAIAGASEIVAANGITINPISALFVIVLWAAAGTLAGAVTGALGGRAANIAKQPFESGALAMSLMATGHLFLPTGVGLIAGPAAWLLRMLRRKWFPRSIRLDVLIAFALAAGATTIPRFEAALPPRITATVPLAASVPLPGSLPVTISVHTSPGFPQVPALHLPLRALESHVTGRRAALWSGRMPDRTRAGRGIPRLLPGGGGLHRVPAWPGARLLASLLPIPPTLEGTVFETVGGVAALAAASDIPVLRGPPAPDDPPYFLRILEGVDAPSTETAEELRAGGAWMDVTFSATGGSVAFSGQGFRLTRASGEVNLIDIAPTTLHLLGLAIPRSVDGRVLIELLEEPGPAGRPPRYRALAASDSTRSR